MRTRPGDGLLACSSQPGLGSDLVGVNLVVATCALALQCQPTMRIGLPPEADVPGPVYVLPVPPILIPLVRPSLIFHAVPSLVLATSLPCMRAGTTAATAELPPAAAAVRLESTTADDTATSLGHAGRSSQAQNSARFVQIPALTRTGFTVRIRPGERRSVGACTNSPAPPSPLHTSPARPGRSSPHPPPAPVGGGSAFAASGSLRDETGPTLRVQERQLTQCAEPVDPGHAEHDLDGPPSFLPGRRPLELPAERLPPGTMSRRVHPRPHRTG